MKNTCIDLDLLGSRDSTTVHAPVGTLHVRYLGRNLLVDYGATSTRSSTTVTVCVHVDLARLDLNMDRHLNMEERRVHLHMEERHVVPTGTGVYFKRTIFKGHFPVDLHVPPLFLSALIKPRDQKACSDPVPPPKGGIF